MSIQKEFELAKKKVDILFNDSERDSIGWNINGMVDEEKALRVLNGSLKVLRETIAGIDANYKINKKNTESTVKQIKDYKVYINKRLEELDIQFNNYGIIAIYGGKPCRTEEEAQQVFERQKEEILDSMDLYRIRLENNHAKSISVRKNQMWSTWLSIGISITALIISIITLIRSIITGE